MLDVPGGPVAKNMPATAEDAVLIPELGRCHGTTEPVPTTTKPTLYTACARQREKPLQRDTHTPQLERSPCSLRQGKPVHSDEDPAQPKIKYINKNFFKNVFTWQHF